MSYNVLCKILRWHNIQRRGQWGIRLRRDSWVSVMDAEGLNSATSSGTLQRTDRHGIVGQKSPHFQLSLYQWQTERATTGPADWVFQKQRPSSQAGHGTAGTPSRVLVVGNGRRPPVVDAAGGRHALPLRLQTRRGGGNAARVFRAAAP